MESVIILSLSGIGIALVRLRGNAKALQKANDQLEQRVAERTAELSKSNEELKHAHKETRHKNEQLEKTLEELRTTQSQLIQSEKMAAVGRAEEQIRSLAKFPDENPNPILRVAKNGTVLYANKAGTPLLKNSTGHAGGVIPDSWRSVINEVSTSGSSREIEVTYGDILYILSFVPVVEAGYVNIYGTDITEGKRAEENLLKEKSFSDATIDSLPGIFYLFDDQGGFLRWNKNLERISGYSAEEISKISPLDFFDGDDKVIIEEKILEVFAKGQSSAEAEFVSKDGSKTPYFFNGIRVTFHQTQCLVGMGIDISEPKRAQRLLEEYSRTLEQKVEERTRDLQEKQTQLIQSEKMAALGKLLAGLAHELNNPAAAAGRAAAQLVEALDELQSATIALARAGLEHDLWDTLTGWAREFRQRSAGPLGLSPLEVSDREEELLKWLDAHGVDEGWVMASTLVTAGIESKELDTIAARLPADLLGAVMLWLCRAITAHDLAGIVGGSTRNISNLVNVVKSYSYMDRAPLQYVDIHAGLEDTITILRHKLKRGIEVVRQYDRGLPHVQVRGGELNQVWTNLIDNAIGGIGEKGTITIRTYRDGDQVAVEMADDGPGIPKEIQPRIFDPFFTTKDVGQGTGLGLDVVRRIVSARAGWQIDFRSRPGETVFRVRVPVESTSSAGA